MKDNVSIGLRIKATRTDAGLTQEGLAIRLGTTRGAVGNWELGKGIKRDNLLAIARDFGISVNWLATGVGTPTEEPTAAEVPLLAMISAGAMMRDDVADEALGTVTVSDLPPGDWIALRVVGDSMDRISPPDSTIFVDRRDKLLVPNGLYVIADTDGNATYKRFRPGPPKRFEPVSSNKDLEPLFPDNDPMIVGRVKRTQLDM
jgi:phage repressor protein C with HTH and peptisase S24 domain